MTTWANHFWAPKAPLGHNYININHKYVGHNYMGRPFWGAQGAARGSRAPEKKQGCPRSTGARTSLWPRCGPRRWRRRRRRGGGCGRTGGSPGRGPAGPARARSGCARAVAVVGRAGRGRRRRIAGAHLAEAPRQRYASGIACIAMAYRGMAYIVMACAVMASPTARLVPRAQARRHSFGPPRRVPSRYIAMAHADISYSAMTRCSHDLWLALP